MMTQEYDAGLLKDQCELCGGSGEVEVTPPGGSAGDTQVVGCPGCMTIDMHDLDLSIEKVKLQRDELLAALREIVDQNDNGIVGVSKPCWERARAVIIKVEAAQ